jgi:hypothetical protein
MWLKHFEESPLSVKNDLKNGNMTLEKTFGLNKKILLQKVAQSLSS